MKSDIKFQKERIEKILSYTHKSKNALGKLLGDKNGMKFTHIINGRNSISESLARAINSKYPEIREDWILYGEGEMIKTKDYKKEDYTIFFNKVGDRISKKEILIYLEENKEEFEKLKEYRMFVKLLTKDEVIKEMYVKFKDYIKYNEK